MPYRPMRIGILSDTHGLLRPEVLTLLAGSGHILHLGDVGDPEILGKLAKLAPVTAIRGNIDTQGPCAMLPETEVVTLASLDFYLLHNIQALDLDPAAAGFAAVLYGHSHKPEIRRHKGVLYLNPGSCGHRRFQLPINEQGQIEAKILNLPM